MADFKQIDLQIEVNGIYRPLDIDRVTSFPFNMQATDITDPAATKVPFSTQITLPATRTNDDIFSNLWSIDYALLNFNPLLRANFRLYVDSKIFQTGYIQLEEITLQYFGVPSGYKIRLYGGLGDYFYTMGEVSEENDMRLSTLDFGDTFTHTINRDLIYKCWNGQRYNNIAGQDLTELLAYVPTYQGQYDNFDSDTVYLPGDTEQNEVTWEASTKKYSSPELDENKRSYMDGGVQKFGEYRSYYQKPMLRFKILFQKIMDTMRERHGWETVLDPTFFNEYNPYWDALWVLCTNYDTADDVTAVPAPFDPNVVNKKLPDSAPSSSYDWYSKKVQNGVKIANANFTPGTIKARTAYSIDCDITFSLWAVLAQSGSGTPDKQIQMDGTANLSVHLFAGETDLGALNVNPGGTLIQLNNDTIARKIPGNFSSKAGWNSSKNLQPFKYLYGQGKNTGRDSAQTGTDFNAKKTIEVSNTALLTDPSTLSIRFIYNGNTYWWRSTSGSGNNDRRYGLNIQIDTAKSMLKISDPTTVGLRSNVKVGFTDIVRSNTTCLDFVKSYCKVFGLYFVKDAIEKKVTILTRNSFFGDQERIDWTRRIDYSKGVSVNPVPFDFKVGVFKWNGLDTKYENQYIADYSKEYGEVRVNTNYQFSDAEKNLLDNIVFDNCIIAQDFSSYFFGRTSTMYQDNKVMPMLQDASGGRVDHGFILLFRNGPTTTLQSQWQFNITDDNTLMQLTGSNWTERTEDKTASNKYMQVTRSREYSGELYSLNFGTPAKAYGGSDEADQQSTESGNSTLYARFWRAYMREIYSQETRRMTCYVKLDSSEVENNIFSKFIFINNTPWVVTKISNYDVTSQTPTKVELLSVHNLDAYVSQKYVAGNLTLSYGGKVIYDPSGETEGASTVSPVIIRVDSAARTVNVTINSTLPWNVVGADQSATVSPVSGQPGTTTLSIAIPANTTGNAVSHSIPIRWGNTTTTIEVVQVSNWTVAASSNVGSATANGSVGQIQVADGANVTFATTGAAGYVFAYWIISDGDGQRQNNTRNLTLAITSNTTVQAIWIEAGSLGWTESSKSIGREGGDLTNYLTVPQGITYNISAPGLVFTPTSGNQSGNVLFNIPGNTTEQTRTFTVTATFSNGITSVFTISQKGISTISINPSVINSDNGAYVVNVFVTTDGAYTAQSSDPSWLVVGGISPTSTTVSWRANTALVPRTATITFRTADGTASAIFTLNQAAAPIIGINPKDARTNSAAGTIDIAVTTNAAWQAQPSASWLSVEKISESLARATWTQNDTGAARTATITFATTDGTGTAVFTIEQV